MTPIADLKQCVFRTLDKLVTVADMHDGLWPSIMDPKTGQMLRVIPPAIIGQREGDRARWGCNLMHDHPLLQTLAQVAQIESRNDYAHTVQHYLHRSTMHCTNIVSGLFPWGEHAYWRLDKNCIGNSIVEGGGKPDYPIIHDHLRAASTWLWEQLHAIHPDCVKRFAQGLDYHFKQGLPEEFSRHACLLAGDPSLVDHPGYERSGRPRRLTGPHDGSNDFPRHAGFYIHDIAFAWSHTGNDTLEAQLWKLVNYCWQRFDGQHCLRLQSRGPDAIRTGLQTLSLAWSLLESARIIETSPRASSSLPMIMRHQAQCYINSCVTPGSSDDLDLLLDTQTPVWGSTYGHLRPVVCRYPHLYTGLYRHTRDDRLLTIAQNMTQRIANTPIPSSAAPIPAMDVATSLQALVDMADLTDDPVWTDHALSLANQSIDIYFKHPLPVGASDITWYESQLGTSQLIHALVRTVYHAQGLAHFPADMSCR